MAGHLYSPRSLDPQTATEANTIAINADSKVTWIEASVPVILLPAGSDAGDVPAGTPIGTIILTEA